LSLPECGDSGHLDIEIGTWHAAGRMRHTLRAMSIDRAALLTGSIRLASGISFLVDPVKANKLWGSADEPTGTHRLLLYSMGYRDALIGGLLTVAAVRGRNTRGWFLASGGADAADLIGGLSVHDELSKSERLIGLGGAAVGIGVGLWGATRRRPPKTTDALTP
jgi:hypothetical protein